MTKCDTELIDERVDQLFAIELKYDENVEAKYGPASRRRMAELKALLQKVQRSRLRGFSLVSDPRDDRGTGVAKPRCLQNAGALGQLGADQADLWCGDTRAADRFA